MSTITNSILFIVGLVLLIKGADIFAAGGICVAKRYKRSGLLMGLTLVYASNSIPVLAVGVAAVLRNANDLALGSIIGACLFNMIFILGMCILIKPISELSSIRNKMFPYIIITGVFFFFIADCYLPWSPIFAGFNTDHLLDQNIGILDRLESVLLLFLFCIFMFETVNSTKKERKNNLLRDTINLGNFGSILYVTGGIIAVIAGSNLVVENVCDLSKITGMSQIMTGLTLVAVSISLPKFVNSLFSLKKDKNGEILGSLADTNVFNILFSLGIIGVLHPLMVNMASFIHIGVLIITGLYTYALLLTRRTMGRFEGCTLVFVYAFYIAYTFRWQ